MERFPNGEDLIPGFIHLMVLGGEKNKKDPRKH
jgi:hypothetical protein